MIVTFKELYLGSGLDLYNAIAKDRLETLLREYGGTAWIPLEHIYFLTIDDFDRLAERVKRGDTTIVETLRKAVSEDREPRTKTFTFSQRIPGFKNGKSLPTFLEQEFQRITDKIEGYFPDSKAAS